MKRSLAALAAAGALIALAGCGGDDENSGASGDYCNLIRSYEEENNALDSAFEDVTPESLEEGMNAIKPMLENLRDQAPAEIEDDVNMMADALLSMIAIFEQYDYDIMQIATAPEFAELQATMEGDDVAAAEENLERYEEEVCGLSS